MTRSSRLGLAVALAVVAACQRRAEPVAVVALVSGARFDVPRGARLLPDQTPGEHSFALADGSVLAVTEETMADSCEEHIAWAIGEAQRSLDAATTPGAAPLTAARAPERVRIGGRSGVRIGLVTADQRVDMLGLCERATFVIFQVAQRGNSLDPALDRLLIATAESLRQ